jgi:hypothetical protein
MECTRKKDCFELATAVTPRLFLLLMLFLGLLALVGVDAPTTQAQTAPPTRRVNVLPFVSGTDFDPWGQTAVFWFGVNDPHTQVPGRNYADVRIATTNNNLILRLTVIDYYLWYNTNPSAATDLTSYDAIALYLDTNHDRAATPQADDYLFLFQARNGQPHASHHRDAQGQSGSWNYNWAAPWNSQSFMDWSNTGPNDNGGNIDYGWTGIFVIPWSSFGLSGPPPQGTVWGMGLHLFDRDANPPAGAVTPQSWPEGVNATSPASWGELHIGPANYAPETTAVTGQTIIRAATPTDNTVEDAWMGGGGLCAAGHNGGSGVNHGADINLFTGSEIRATHFPCYNKSFLRFDLSAIPPGKTIISAELSMHLWSHAGETPDLATPSWVSLHSIKDSWQEMTIHWNNAPLAYENIAATWVNPYSGDRDHPVWPGDSYTWDASKAVAEAYAAGQPVNLALYGSDTDEHSSKYFYSSESNAGTSASDGRGRPSLTITWGETGPTIAKTAVPAFGDTGDTITYHVTITGNGGLLALEDVVPAGLQILTYPGLGFSGGRLTWSGTLAAGAEQTFTYTAQITAANRAALSNTAVLRENGVVKGSDTAVVIANPIQVYLPVAVR